MLTRFSTFLALAGAMVLASGAAGCFIGESHSTICQYYFSGFFRRLTV